MDKQILNTKYPCTKLKFVASINDEALTEDTDPDWEMDYIDIGNVNSSGEIDEVVTYKFSYAPSRARRKVRQGDVIISTVRTYLRAIASINKDVENLIVSTGFAVIRPIKGVFHPDFCKYALTESSFIDEVQKRSVGVSYPAINASDLGDIYIPIPAYKTQLRISRYLNKEIEEIEKLIKAKAQLLNILFEKQQTLITQAVTRGLDKHVKLKSSGIDWLGEIPMHWDTERTKWLFRERNDRSETGEEDLLTVSHITGVTLRSEKDVNMFEAESKEGYKIAKEGDLVINTLWAWMGAMGVSNKYGIVSPAYHVYEPLNRLDPAYVDAIVRLPIFANEVAKYSKGVWSSRLRLYPDGFYEVYLPVPPIKEQDKIVKYLKLELSKIETISDVTKKSIKLLKERRTALISAAVTGLIEMPRL